jgi:3-oxoacyl-[acyl-carrier-protein] synthase-3
MNQPPRIGVLSLGTYIPKPRLTSEQLAQKTGIPRGVIEDKLGILQKPMPGPEDHPCVMGARAADVAIARAGIDPLEIDAVISISE